MRGTDTGGSAATFCGGWPLRSLAVSACPFATPFRKTLSTIWSE